jgi:hypothetical protein
MVDRIQLIKSDVWGDGMLRRQDRYSRIFLKHIPVMITDKGKILCIPNTDETSHVGFVAQTGKGKGIGGHSLFALHYWFLKVPCLIFNDFQQETFENSLPCQNVVFNNNLKIVGLKPMPLPMVYVYPSNRNLKIKEVEELFPHIKLCLPTKVVIKNIENFYKLDKSGKYVTGYIDEFLECENLEDIGATIDTILQENFPDSQGKKFEEMKFKISTIFKNIFDEKITDTSSSADAYSYLTINKKGFKYTNLTIQALMAAGLIPSIQTSDIKNERWFSAYMAFIANSIYWDKFNDDFLSTRNMCIYIPEIDKMYRTDIGLDHGALIKKEISLWGTNGRRAGIRVIWDCQKYDFVIDSMRNNTKYLFVGRMSFEEEVREIKKDFNVNKDVQGWILGLNTDQGKGQFEFVALTSDRFVLYNPKDGSMSVTSEPQKGFLITPMSQHKQSGVPIQKIIGYNEEVKEIEVKNV